MTGKFLSMQNSFLSSSCRIGFGFLLMAGTCLTFTPSVFAQDSVLEGSSDALPEANSDGGLEGVLSEEDGASDSALGEGAVKDDASSKEDDAFSLDDQEGVELEKSSEELESDFRRKAFDSALDKVLPLQPAEIREVLEKFDRTVESSNLPAHPYPRPESVVNNISLDPGSPPLVVRLAFGYVTTLSILDSSGSPWPIEDISWVGDFEIMEQSGRELTNLLRISPGSQFAHGNVSMRLLGLDAPVLFTFETSRDMVHYRYDAIVPKIGPQAKAQLIDTGIQLTAGDVDMSTALAGIVPDDAERLAVSGVDGRTSAYIYNGLTYVRTPLTLLSPAWNGSVTSADGMRVYALDETPVILLSDKGRMVRAHLTAQDQEGISNE